MIRVETRRNGQLTGVVSDWQRLVWREQVNTVTGGTITLPQSSPALAELLTASATTDIVGIVISDDELVSDVGVWHLPAYVAEENLTSAEDTVTIPFRLDTALINEVPAFPDPTTPADPFGAVATWSQTGALELITARFLKAQVGVDASAAYRRFDLVTYSYVAPGPTVTYAARMQPCLDYIAGKAQGLAVINAYLAAGVGMRCHVRGLEDKPNVVFSRDLSTLTSYAWKNAMPPANTFYAGGTGTGTGRDLAIATLASPLWPRKRGLFIDRSSGGGDLQTAANEAAVWAGPTLELVATDATGLRYWTDWQLGDTVRADVAGTRYTLPVTAIDAEAAAGGTVTRKLTLGAPRLDGRDVVDVRRQIISTYGLQENP